MFSKAQRPGSDRKRKRTGNPALYRNHEIKSRGYSCPERDMAFANFRRRRSQGFSKYFISFSRCISPSLLHFFLKRRRAFSKGSSVFTRTFVNCTQPPLIAMCAGRHVYRRRVKKKVSTVSTSARNTSKLPGLLSIFRCRRIKIPVQGVSKAGGEGGGWGRAARRLPYCSSPHCKATQANTMIGA